MSEFDSINLDVAARISVDETTTNNAKVKVFGVGGAGGNTVNRMVKMDIEGVEYYAVNTDAKALDLSLADHKIAIGKKATNTLGAGMKPEVGRKAVEENIEDLREAMKGADLVFITAGMGGGTGTGAAPVVGTVAREMGILTVAVVTKPFKFEGKRRAQLAANGIQELRSSVDTMIVVDNDKLLSVVQNTDKNLTLDGAFKLTDEILGNAVRSICDIMFRHGLIHVDFADIKTVMTNGGSALMGTGIAEGDGRGVKAVDMALSSPLLEDINVDGATGVLVNVSHGENFSMLEYNEAMEHIHEAVSDKNDPNIIIGDILLPELGDKVCITIIATGCGSSNQAFVQPAPVVSSVHSAPQQPVVQPAPQPVMPQQTINNCYVGAPTVQQMTAPQQSAAPQPVAATPRPTGFNFAALAHQPVPSPVTSAAAEARTIPMAAVQPAAPVERYEAPSFEESEEHVLQQSTASFCFPSFDAMGAAEEEVMAAPTATATLVEEMPGLADVDPFNGVANNLQEPAYVRNTMEMPSATVSTPVAPAAPQHRTFGEMRASLGTPKQDDSSLKESGVNYDTPAWQRMQGMNSDAF